MQLGPTYVPHLKKTPNRSFCHCNSDINKAPCIEVYLLRHCLLGTLLITLCVSGCSSVSHQTARNMEPEQIAIAGESCSQAVETAPDHDGLKWGRMIATPVLTVASAGLIPALLGANAALDYADRRNASEMREVCGYAPLSQRQMLTDVATNTGISMGLTTIDFGLGSDVARVQANSSN